MIVYNPFRTWRGLGILVVTVAVSWGQNRLGEASLEQLLNVQVTSVSKKEQRLSRVAAAVFVLNQEDIRRSGAANIPDLLRMVPGLNIAQIDANAWAISIRGFSSRYANKVLVLVDGRTVYTPTFSGVFWEHLDQPLENIERIEIIRGPGATLWGGNAVNGVIDIITKSAKSTQGGLVSVASGSQVHASDTVQYGGKAGSKGSYRLFGKYSNFASSKLVDGPDAADGWNRAHAGFRSDWDVSRRDSLTVEGDLFSNREGQTLRPGFIPAPGDRLFSQKLDATGGNLVARWSHTLMGGSDTAIQVSADTYRRTDQQVPEKVKTLDFDFQHHVALGGRHDLVWGGGFRSTYSGLAPGYPLSFSQPFRTDRLFSIFVQDEMRVAENLWLTLGSKFERNSYTGFEYEPSARLVWTPSIRHALWAAASRAIRQPARIDTDLNADLASIPQGPYVTTTIRLIGNRGLQPEESRDYEVGYRAQLSPKTSLDLTGYLTFYRHLMTMDPGQPQIVLGPPPIQVIVPVEFGNGAAAVSYGGELFGNWNVTGRWRVSPGYSYAQTNPRIGANAVPGATYTFPILIPKHTIQIRSFWNVTRKLEFDQTLSWTLPTVQYPPWTGSNLPGTELPAHARLDARVSRKIGESAEASLVGQNLLRPGIVEVTDAFRVIGSQARRSVYGKLTWTF
jgi:iron complex outermembrane receptor protein